MKIVIVGAGKVGLALIQQLSQEHHITVIDQNPALIDNIINVYDVMNADSFIVDKAALTKIEEVYA